MQISILLSPLQIEDFLDRFENFARSVGSDGIRKICQHINISLNNISDFAANRIEAPKLKELLFKPGEVKILNDQPVRKKLGKRKRMRMEQTKGKDKVASDQPKRNRQDSSTPATANSKGAKKPKFSKQTGILNQPVYQMPFALPIIMLPPVQPQVCNELYRPAPGFALPQVHDESYIPAPDFVSQQVRDGLYRMAPDFVPRQVHDELYRPVPDFVSQQVHDGPYRMAPDFVPPPFRLYDHPQRPVPPFLPGYGNGHPAPFIPEHQSHHRVPSHRLSFHDVRYYPENPPFMDDVRRYYPENPPIRHPGFGRQW